MSRVYIGRLSYQARERDIERFFRGYGHIREVNLKNGFGFVEFDDSRDAEDAVYDLNGRELCGDRVIIEHARGPARGRDDRYGGGGGGGGGGRNIDRGDRRPGWIDNHNGSSSHSGRSSRYGPPVRTDYRVIVENLSSRVSWQDLKDYMRQSGEVTFADAHKQRKNEGIVEFASWSDMHSAIKKLDGTELNGRNIRIVEDNQHKKKRDYSRSRSRSRSRSPRRSRSRSARRSRSRSRSHRRSRSRRRSRSASHSRSRSHSRCRKSNSKSRSRSKSPRRSQSKSPRRSASPRKSNSRSRSRSRSKSRSGSPKD